MVAWDLLPYSARFHLSIHRIRYRHPGQSWLALNWPHERTPPTNLRGDSSDPVPGLASNFGSRIDCFAWGEGVTTCGDGQNGIGNLDYTDIFGGTSSASAIITGVVLVIQSLAKTRRGSPLSSTDMRSLLSNPAHGTRVYAPSNLVRYQVIEGYMPDLQKILSAYFGISHEDLG